VAAALSTGRHIPDDRHELIAGVIRWGAQRRQHKHVGEVAQVCREVIEMLFDEAIPDE